MDSFFVNIANEIIASDGLKLVLAIGIVFAVFVFWRIGAVVKALNTVEATTRKENRDTTKIASESKGQIDIIKKVMFKDKGE
jgi:hypothetical protein